MQPVSKHLHIYVLIIALERYLSRGAMTRLRYIFFSLFCLSAIALIGISILKPTFDETPLFGLTLLTFGLWLEQILIYCYHNSYYFKGLDSIIAQEGKSALGVTYEVAKTLLVDENDITKSFLTSAFGHQIILRSGLTEAQVAEFLNGVRIKITAGAIPCNPTNTTTLIDIGLYLLEHDKDFANFLRSQAIARDTFIGALQMVISNHHIYKRQLRWWSRDQLSLTKGIGRELAYGTAYELEHYSRPLESSSIYGYVTKITPEIEVNIIKVEQTLARSKHANILLVGNPGVGKIDILINVNRRLKTGKALNALSGQHFILLDTQRLLTNYQNPDEFEVEFLTILDQAAKAGDVTIIIENISSFITEVANFGLNLPEILDTYLAIAGLHIIGTDTPHGYHQLLEPLGAFVRRFEEILIEETYFKNTTQILESIALEQERKHQILFTYGALTTITIAADRYLISGVMPDKAISLLSEVASRAASENDKIITSDFVLTFVSHKTGIPIGPIQDDERNQLLHLEEILHSRVVGQDRAVHAIARTIRRARVDIERNDKPIGSFLFLGPTGVGKTETAKALAEVFFGSEDTTVRFDMSEFSHDAALGYLIGDHNGTGMLTDRLHEHPYTVLLLDEFEKAHTSVHDLFLQILDEGYFTDSRGQRVNTRNTIIIATSNAGSKLIIQTTKSRMDTPTLDNEIINHIITTGIFKPELLNRFDSTIIFEPLDKSEQREIAALMLADLTSRIQTQGYTLTIDQELMDIILEKGYSLSFGVRPMQRVLQDLIEEKIAQLIIAGDIQKGDEIELTKNHFTATELAAI